MSVAGPLVRLPFLYPVLFKPSRPVVPRLAETAGAGAGHYPPGRSPQAGFSASTRRRRPETVSQRYGSANEVPPHLIGAKPIPPPNHTAQKSLLKPETSPRQQKLAQPAAVQIPKDKPETKGLEAKTLSRLEQKNERTSKPATKTAETKAVPLQGDKALSTILRMEPPMSDKAEKPPHLEAPPYVHNFDTYTLVRDLEKGGFSAEQAITIMKSVRGLLAVNMDLARDGLVSKTDAEMETYLFRSASAELRTEIRAIRALSTTAARTDLTHLQHSIDILSQSITQQTLSLKDELKGMFDDRKMSVRIERRDLENRIQELNYKITVTLNSEMRSQVEGLRWVLTRRTAFAILAVAVMTLTALRYAKYMERRSELDRKRLEKLGPIGDGGGGGGGAPAAGGEAHVGGTGDQGDVMKRIDSGDSVALLSLG